MTQINIVIGTIIASLAPGAVSWLYYADRLYQLPLGIVGIAVGVVLLPDLARALRGGRDDVAAHTMNRSMEFAAALTLPAAVALFVIPGPIIEVLFQRGAFSAADTAATAPALAAYAAGLPAFVAIRVLQPGYFAREDTRTPMHYGLVSLVVNVVAAFALFFLLRRAATAMSASPRRRRSPLGDDLHARLHAPPPRASGRRCGAEAAPAAAGTGGYPDGRRPLFRRLGAHALPRRCAHPGRRCRHPGAGCGRRHSLRALLPGHRAVDFRQILRRLRRRA